MELVARSRQRRIMNYLSKEAIELTEDDKNDQELQNGASIDASEVMVAKEDDLLRAKKNARISMRSSQIQSQRTNNFDPMGSPVRSPDAFRRPMRQPSFSERSARKNFWILTE